MTSSAKTIEGPVQAKIVPFSSVVGQSIMLTDETGAVVAQLSISIPSPSYPYRETAEEVACIIETAINQPPSQQLKRLRARLGKLMVEDAKRMAALEDCKPALADANSNPPSSDLSSLRKGAEDWRDINTAPKDGTLILVPGRHGLAVIACWWPAAHLEADYTLRGDWDDGERNEDEGFTPFDPKVWMPLPTVPAALVSGSREDGA